MSGEKGKEIYFTRRWRHLRDRIRERDGHLCSQCKANGLTVAGVDVHHKKPLFQNPELAFNEDNLILLCRPCHYKHKEVEKSEKEKAWQRLVDELVEVES